MGKLPKKPGEPDRFRIWTPIGGIEISGAMAFRFAFAILFLSERLFWRIF